MDEFHDIFVEEAREQYDVLESNLLALEENPNDEEAVNALFRVFHTLKGMAATLEYGHLQHLAHNCENLLDEVRKGTRKATSSLVDALLSAADAVRENVEAIAARTEEPDQSALVERIMAAAAAESGDGPAGEAPAPQPTKKDPNPKAKKAKKAGAGPTTAKASPTNDTKPTPTAGGAPRAAGPSTIRVSTAQLETIVDTVGELVISKSRLVDVAGDLDRPDLVETLDQIDRLTSLLYQDVLRTRMVPVRQIYDRFPRMVRDLTKALGKEVELKTIGQDVEIDRSLVEQLGDPLLHILRNSIDHGVEPPEEREAAGKPRVATVRVEARGEHNRVIIDVADDGKGIDPEFVKRRGIERGLLTEQEASALSRNDTYLLLCRPGFSTAESVTQTSGRGVGMDVVKSWVEHVGGSLRIRSDLGKGTTISLRLPLTLAVQRGLVVQLGGERYILPIDTIEETVDLQGAGVRMVHGREVFVRDGEVIPLVHLADVLGVAGADRQKERYAVVVERHGRKAGLAVERDQGQLEVVVKNFDRDLLESRVLAGATVMGDGLVALILDVAGVLDAVSKGAGRIGAP